jgi:hypothetical protein
MNPSERQDEIDRLCENEYKMNGRRCNELSAQGRKREAALCWEDANEQYAQCLKEESADRR